MKPIAVLATLMMLSITNARGASSDYVYARISVSPSECKNVTEYLNLFSGRFKKDEREVENLLEFRRQVAEKAGCGDPENLGSVVSYYVLGEDMLEAYIEELRQHYPNRKFIQTGWRPGRTLDEPNSRDSRSPRRRIQPKGNLGR